MRILLALQSDFSQAHKLRTFGIVDTFREHLHQLYTAVQNNSGVCRQPILFRYMNEDCSLLHEGCLAISYQVTCGRTFLLSV